MEYKKKQQEFKRRLKNQVKMIWVSKEITTIPHPTLEKEFVKIIRLVKGNYIKSVHGLIGSKVI